MVQKRIRKATIGVGITAGVILGTAIIFKKFNIGSQIIDSLRGFGKTAGLAVTTPISGLIQGVSEGAGEVAQSAGTAGADFQETITGNRNAIGDWWASVTSGGGSIPTAEAFGIDSILKDLDSMQARPTSRNTQSDISLSLSSIFSNESITSRLEKTFLANTDQGYTNQRGTSRDKSKGGFGGFGSAESQEIALRKAIDETKAKYPQYFSS